jgi:hypothetical protein
MDLVEFEALAEPLLRKPAAQEAELGFPLVTVTEAGSGSTVTLVVGQTLGCRCPRGTAGRALPGGGRGAGRPGDPFGIAFHHDPMPCPSPQVWWRPRVTVTG